LRLHNAVILGSLTRTASFDRNEPAPAAPQMLGAPSFRQFFLEKPAKGWETATLDRTRSWGAKYGAFFARYAVGSPGSLFPGLPKPESSPPQTKSEIFHPARLHFSSLCATLLTS
jgi:hypothetical protein